MSPKRHCATFIKTLVGPLAYNIIAIPMAAFGLLSPTVAAVAMSFSSITVVMNALRLKGMKLEQIEGGEPMAQTIFNVTDMDCNHCVKTISNGVRNRSRLPPWSIWHRRPYRSMMHTVRKHSQQSPKPVITRSSKQRKLFAFSWWFVRL